MRIVVFLIIKSITGDGDNGKHSEKKEDVGIENALQQIIERREEEFKDYHNDRKEGNEDNSGG